MISVSISRNAPKLASFKQTRALVETILPQIGIIDEVEVSITIKNDAALAKLNKQYRGIPEPTDVLSFPGEFTDPETGRRYLGDIVISYERITAQAEEHLVTPDCEYKLLLTHGLLHLAGHDHGTTVEKRKMRKAQTAILKQLGCEFAEEVIL